jgi:pimeloyl-ACP methyl ester carboxylesterase
MANADDPVSRYVRRSENADTVIVFVHGVLGEGKTTWTSANGSYWPEMLVKDTSFDGTDIFVYSYPTGYWASLTIDELAENMRAVLVANGVSKYPRLIFLSHSMGGLITRAFLLKNRDVATQTLFAYFFSTPTNGSQIASIASAFLDNPQISKMKTIKPEDYLADRLRDWLGAKFEFPSFCAYEKRPTRGISLVVSMDSAASLCTRALDPIDTDHIDIVKPESENAYSYIVFKAAFTDAKVRQLEDKLDRKLSSKIASEVTETIRFPNPSGVSNSRTLLESLLVDKKPQLVFAVLEKYNRQDIEAIPKIGRALYQFKIDYYDFQNHESAFESRAMTRIGEMVKVRFSAGWFIYLRYVLLRSTGNSQDQVKAWGSFLNYEITWEDAERVFAELSKDKEIAADIAAVGESLKKAIAGVTQVASGIQ